ncbi:MAG: glycosyltransferase family 4 protein [Cyanobacteria bacterium CRU_2_1]|nr:glycosyltransferase family 4 protein [Cyanobacteria bacterium CRU_2_1]
MRVAIVRRAANASFSMDVYADGLVQGLRAVRPNWDIVELIPQPNPQTKRGNGWLNGICKYYQRYWSYPLSLQNQKVNLFHIIDHSDGHYIYGLKKTNKPIVVTCHDLINFLHPENIADQARFPLISTAIWKYSAKGICESDHIVTVSDYTAKDVMKILKVEPEYITVVPDAVESSFHRLPPEHIEAIRQKYHIPHNKFCLLNVGSNHPRKNISTVLNALNALKNQGVPVHLLKTGAEFTREQKAFITTHQLADCITYLGKPDRETLVQIYNAADVLLSPSLYEGFGMTVLEAMACGTPVITSNVTSLPEVAGDAAMMVHPTDVQAIVDAVCRLHNNSTERQLLIDRGLARVQLFTWEITAEKIAQIYETLLKGTP